MASPSIATTTSTATSARFAKAFDLGVTGNKLYVSELFSGPGKNVAAFMSAGSTDGQIDLLVNSGSKLHVVSCVGVEQELPVKSGRVKLQVPEVPVYVELAVGAFSWLAAHFALNLTESPLLPFVLLKN